MRIRMIVTVMAAVAAVGCGKSEEQKAAEATAEALKVVGQATAQAAQGAAQGMQQMANAMQGAQATGPDGKPLPPVDFEKLIDVLPSPGGWEKGKPTGQQMSAPFAMSIAEVRYTKGQERVKVTITDAIISRAFLLPFMSFVTTGYSERSTSGYKKSAALNGFPGYEDWNSESNRGEVTVVVGNRFLVQGEGSNLSSIDAARGIVSQVDMTKLSKLK